MYIPTFEGTPLSFLQQIMSTEKKFFKKSETFNAVIPNWPELSVKRIWPEAIKHKDFLLYLPDNWLQDKKTERAFFWTILATLQPDYCLHLIDDCRRQRDSLRLPPRPPPVKRLGHLSSKPKQHKPLNALAIQQHQHESFNGPNHGSIIFQVPEASE